MTTLTSFNNGMEYPRIQKYGTEGEKDGDEDGERGERWVLHLVE